MASQCYLDVTGSLGAYNLGQLPFADKTALIYMDKDVAALLGWVQPANSPCITPLLDQPYNYVDAAAAWAFAFTWVLTLWFIAKNAGIIVNAIRKF